MLKAAGMISVFATATFVSEFPTEPEHADDPANPR
jgi:hypothetical protein